MKRWLLLMALAAPTAVSAQSAYPNFTQGSMTSTTTTDTTIEETIAIESTSMSEDGEAGLVDAIIALVNLGIPIAHGLLDD